MRKKLLLICAVVAICVSAAVGQNLITNGDLEIWKDTTYTGPISVFQPASYVIQGAPDPTWYTQVVGRGGSGYAIQFNKPTTATTGNNRFRLPYASSNNAGTYKFSFYSKGKASLNWIRYATGPGGLGTEGTNYVDILASSSSRKLESSDWVKNEYSFALKSDGPNFHYMYLMISSYDASTPSDIIIDDFSLEYVSPSLNTNGDMENWKELSPGVPDSIPVGYKVLNPTGVGIFSQALGYGGTGYAQRIQSPVSSVANNNRFITPGASLIAEKKYQVSFMIKGKGTITCQVSASSTGNMFVNQSVLCDDIEFNYPTWTPVTYIFTAKATATYYTFFVIGADNDGPTDTYLDDFSIMEYYDTTLKSIKFQNPTSVAAEGNFSLPGFNAATTNYDFPLWFGTDTVPTLLVEATDAAVKYSINYGGSKKFSETNDPSVKTKPVTITTSAPNGYTKDYTITFDRTDFVAGFFNNFVFGPNNEFADRTEGYRTSDAGHGLYWGSCAFRPNSGNGGSITTAELKNGAGTLSFWTGRFSSSSSISEELYIKVTYRTNAGAWQDVTGGTIRIDSVALNGKWTEFTFDIKQADPTTQVKLEYVMGASAVKYAPFNIDDMRITPYTATNIPEIKNKITALNVYPKGQSIIIAEEGTYKVYTVNGQLIASGNSTGQSIVSVKSGLYIVKMANQAKKIIVK